VLLEQDMLAMGVFVFEIDGQAMLAINAQGIAEAEGICALPEFRDDLCGITTGGVPLCRLDSVLTARPATVFEAAAYDHAHSQAAEGQHLTIAFLVKVDTIVVTVVSDQ
jgi:hypothetical protein